jgi:DNA-binding NtrC family response regulator/tetratricopeptide (TPR) repeat protein
MNPGAGPVASSPLAQLLGESPAIAAVREQVERLLRRQAEGARRLAPILVLGETGTGKGLLAGILHRAGPRAGGPFVDVNCAAIPETLLEAELFGFERGAFTDARHAKAGLLQTAHRGMLFLDEVGLLPEGLQAKLLTVLEERSVRRLGSTRSEPVDVWIVAATSEDLPAATRARRFREDLYHRLAVLTLRLPPLRERGDDIVRLAEHFLGQACADYGLGRRTLAPDARAALLAHAWPGNVRELANTMERVALLADEITVTVGMLGLPPARRPRTSGSSPADERRALAEAEADAERSRLLEALRATSWNLSQAAARLGIPRNTLRYRMERLGLGTALSTRRPTPRPGEAPPTGIPAGVTASQPEESATAQVHDSAPAGIRWEPRRVSFLGARLVLARVEPGSLDTSRAMAIVLDKAQSFGGELDALSPTRLVAAFGIGAVEDAPRHAASAAMAIQRTAARARLENPARPGVVMAIHTTVLPVGRHSGGHELDTDARRSALAVLEGLETCAEPGDVIVSAQAAAFLTRRFELARVGPAAAGVGEAYRLAGPADVDHGLTAFVGRDAELGLLRERFHQVEAGRGQVVSIVGEPGIGKSRLLRELRRQVAGRATWMEGQAISFGRTIAFHPLIDLMRRTVGIDDGDPEAVIVDKIERAALQLGEDLRPALPFLRYLLAVDPGDAAILQLDPKLRRAGIFDAVRRFLARTAESRPVVAVWEDVHWTDQATEEFLALLADGVAACRILMILTHRPGYAPSALEHALHARIALPALSTAESMAMVRGLLAVDVPEALQALLVRRAEGNPFFVEEILRSLQEGGAVRQVGDRVVVTEDLDGSIVPDTVQDVVLTRIQRLRDAPRRTLEVAAVIGREFSRRLVDRLAGPPDASAQALHELKAVDLIHEKSVFPETTYAFEHAVTHEVAYAAIRPERRRELHHAIGSAIEEVYAERLPEQYEVLAFHFGGAGERPKALEYLLKAAEKAANAFATREALALYDQALEILGETGSPDLPTVMDIHAAKATLYFVLSEFDRSRAEAERIVPLARQIGDRMREAKALAGIAWAATWARDLDGAVARAREAIQAAEPVAGEAVLARAHLTIGFVRAVSGGLEEARDAIDRALVASQSGGEVADRSLVLSVAGLLKNWEADYAAAARLQAEGLALARRHNLLVPLLLNFFLHGLTLAGKGDYERALALFREGLTFAESVGDEAIHHRLLNCLGWVHAELGDLEGAIELNRRSAEVGRRRSDPGTFPNAEVNLGDVYLAKGDLALAAEHLEGAYAFCENPRTSQWMRWRYSIRLFASLGGLWLARGDTARAEEWAGRCLDLATRTNSRKNLVKGWRLRGEIALARRELEGAEDAFGRALAIAEAIGNPAQLWKTHAAWGRLWTARRRPHQADEAYRAARGVLDDVAGRLHDPILRASLRQAPGVREIYGLARADEVS